MGLEQAKVGSFINAANGIFNQLTTVAQGLLCVPSLLGQFLSKNTSLAGVSNSLSGALGSTVSNIINTIVQNEVSLAGNLLAQAARQQYQQALSIIQTFRSIFNALQGAGQKVDDTLDFIKGQENCAYASSQLISCILATSSNLQKSLRTPSQKLQEFNWRMTDAVAGKSGIINNYAVQNLKAVDKAKMQLTFQNLL